MKIFISWSGERSLVLAKTLQSFLPKVVQNIEAWVSDTSIDKGARGPVEIRTNLEQAAAGIVCLTSENLDERWLLFEAGALSLKPIDRVWTFLLDVQHAQVEKPLSDFQHTLAEKIRVWEMVQSIHKAISATEKSTPDHLLQTLFDTFWDQELAPKIEELRQQGSPVVRPPRSEREMITEVLETVRDLQRVGKDDNWRVAKTMLLLADLYQQVTGKRAPSIKDLAARNEEQAALDALNRMRPYDGADLSWQPQYANTPLPLRAQARPQVTKVEPIRPPDEPPQGIATPVTPQPKPSPHQGGTAEAILAEDAGTGDDPSPRKS
jgi:hypothetical protein